jgi:hypothetical protein
LTGFKTLSHGGDLRGHHTYVYIMPDLDVGVFHTFNLQTAKQQREMVSAYVVDVLLGEEPFFTAQDVCAVRRTADEENNDPLRSASAHVVTMADVVRGKPVAKTEDYVGLYGNFYYGNVTITTEEVGEEVLLRLLYGEGDYLLVEEESEEFLLVGNNALSSRVSIGRSVVFSRDEFETVESVTIAGMESLDPPVFIKGLDMSDAPPADLHTC